MTRDHKERLFLLGMEETWRASDNWRDHARNDNIYQYPLMPQVRIKASWSLCKLEKSTYEERVQSQIKLLSIS